MSPKTSEVGFGKSLPGSGGTGGGKLLEAVNDETEVGKEPLMVRLIEDFRKNTVERNTIDRLLIDHEQWTAPTSCPGTRLFWLLRKTSPTEQI